MADEAGTGVDLLGVAADAVLAAPAATAAGDEVVGRAATATGRPPGAAATSGREATGRLAGPARAGALTPAAAAGATRPDLPWGPDAVRPAVTDVAPRAADAAHLGRVVRRPTAATAGADEHRIAG